MKKGRIWASVGYPESLPTNWMDILQETGLPVAISPLHDKDINPTGEPKKPHYHFIFNYDGPTTYKHVKELCDSLNMTIPIKLESLRGMYRYHIHIDNPEKYQYDDRDRMLLNGFDVSSVEELTKLEVDKLKMQIQLLIVDNDIREYADLMILLKDGELFNLWRIASSHTMFFDKFISSRRNKINDEAKKKTTSHN